MRTNRRHASETELTHYEEFQWKQYKPEYVERKWC
jgi:hypothetical protein